MIISRTPFRISYFGGGTDFPDWYNNYGGKVISTTINKYCYVNIRTLPPFFKFRYRLRYWKTEEVNKLNQIKHPSIKETLKFKRFFDSIELLHNADLPAQSGLGASSSFTVGLINCINAKKGLISSKRMLASEAAKIEQDRIGEYVGSQDQYAAAFGGFNIIKFNKNKIEVKTIPNNFDNIKILEDSTVLVFTGYQRKASLVEKKKIKNISKKKNLYKDINALTNEAEKILDNSKNIVRDYSELLNEYWNIKKKLSENVSNLKIDNLVRYCQKNGAEGTKLLGAGNGGFLMCLVKKKNKKKFYKNLQKKLIVPIKFENLGSQLIYYSSNEK